MNLAFVDIETTGLDYEGDAVLEIGIVIFNPSTGEIEDEHNWVLDHPVDAIPHYDPHVVEMHTKNGLWQECGDVGIPTGEWENVSENITDFLIANNAVGGPICGNSVHFDRRFLETQEWGFMKNFNHRNLDVSVLGILNQYFPAHMPERAPSSATHRALDDCKNSIGQLKFYLEQITPGADFGDEW